MTSPGEVVSLPGGGEIHLTPNTDGGVYFAVYQGGLSARFTLDQDAVTELREGLAFMAMAARVSA
jgi:hypothetical protein